MKVMEKSQDILFAGMCLGAIVAAAVGKVALIGLGIAAAWAVVECEYIAQKAVEIWNA